MKYTILLGDWSGDGHNFTKTFYLDITENFTEEELKVNYNNNVDKIGFGYGAIACEYEDSIISCEQIKALEKAGMNFVYLGWNEEEKLTEYLNKENKNYQTTVPLQKHFNEKENPQKFYFSSHISFIRIIMFMIGNGLEDFQWSHFYIESKVLVGGYSSPISREQAGYGLFSF